MIVYEDECVGCPPNMGCLGSACPYMNVPHCYCDKCGMELEDYNEYSYHHLCDACKEDEDAED